MHPFFVNVFCVVFQCSRLHNAVQAKQKDRQTVGQLEKRLKAEQEGRAAAEKQLTEEKKRKKLEEATAARAVALAAASRYVALLLFPPETCLLMRFTTILPVFLFQRGVHRHAEAAYH